MTPEHWRRVEQLFDLVADLPAVDQAARLAEACGADTPLFAEVWQLLEHDRSRGASVRQTLEGLAALESPAAPDAAGRRIGAYRVVREIGRGGMGMVFEALRDDDTFRKRVAVKVATGAVWSPDLVRRFQAERQILARLEHPHIARLLDGGTTDEGIPFFAMDYVEGEPLPAYAAARRLAVRDRLRLFLQVCEAVEYAHQNLVVHCDLKPGNILVANGSVRLLDFGIARLLEPVDGVRTTTGAAPLTPDYCSPEQLRGEPVTTRTDVYALGLVLYELLTGERGQVADTTSPMALDRSVCKTPLAAPSARVRSRDPALARQLAGDLDTIVLRAARKEPARRYQSVAALAEDLERHLAHQPIRARQDRYWYRAARAARRHWLPLGAAALVVLALAVGGVAAAYQARRAERRFAQVRSIANALMVDVHDAIRDLPSSTEAQEVVVRTALQYLDGLAPEARGDRTLQLDLVRGYLRVAELSHSLSRPSLGRPDDARRAYDKAAALLASLESAAAADAGVAVAGVAYRTQRAGFLIDTDSPDRAAALLQDAVARGEAALRAHPDDRRVLVALREAIGEFTSSLSAHPGADPLFDRYIEISQALAARSPDDPDTMAGLAVAYSQRANKAAVEGEVGRAGELYRRAIDLQARIIAREPENATARRNLMIAWSNVADVALGPLGGNSYTGAGGPPVALGDAQRTEARQAFDRALDQARWLRARDPQNDTVRFDYAVCLGRSAPSWPPGDIRAVEALHESLAIVEDVARDHPARPLPFLVEFRGSLAERYRQMGRIDRAVAEWRQVERLLEEALARDPDAYYPRRLVISIFENWAESLVAAGQPAAGVAMAERVLRLADEVGAREAQYARAAGWPPRVRAWFAGFQDRLGNAEAAARLRRESREMWVRVAARSDVPDDLRREARAAANGPGSGR